MDNQINKLYDIIVQKYDDYINYNKIVEKEKEQIKEKREKKNSPKRD